ncbi:MAG: bifunctional riboflavin kinase/FAD synthetase [Bacillota bacterium]|nr:bifunctional riboflavin kinase/FAD synthetase [Bacillota bacterium]
MRRSDRLEGFAASRARVAIGAFDGVHLGHRELIRRAVERARGEGGEAVALTFWPHPAYVLAPAGAPKLLTSREERARRIAALGVDALFEIPFSREIAAWPAERFVRELLVARLQVRTVVVGYNFTFGRGAEGRPETLRRLGEELGFETVVLEPVCDRGQPVSSSRIRALVEAGEVREAARLLGGPFRLEGRVVPGDRRGRALGFPTANLEPPEELLRPARGVYAGWAERLEQEGDDGGGSAPRAAGRWRAVVNVGLRPTFDGRRETVEAHLLDVQLDLYGARLAVDLVERLREERAFPSAEALRLQIAEDVEAARRRLAW